MTREADPAGDFVEYPWLHFERGDRDLGLGAVARDLHAGTGSIRIGIARIDAATRDIQAMDDRSEVHGLAAHEDGVLMLDTDPADRSAHLGRAWRIGSHRANLPRRGARSDC